ncbi:MAG: hypothetical protein EBS55_08155 [Flavobacteriaceae bacterium]|nr:hypothetical protein [Flavobacteriaceae bacterium]
MGEFPHKTPFTTSNLRYDIKMMLAQSMLSSKRILKKVTADSYRLVYFFALIFFCFPIIWLSRGDFWDGTYISYATETNDYSQLHKWFSMSSVQLQYYLILGVDSIANLLNLPFTRVNAVLNCIILLLFLLEFRKISEKYFHFTSLEKLLAGVVLAIFPAFSLFSSSVLTFYLVSLFLGWHGSRKYVESIKWKKLGYFVIIVVSFQYQVMLLVNIVLVTGYSAIKFPKSRIYNSNLIFVFLSSVLFKILAQIYNAPSGLYENYNKIKNPLNSDKVIDFFYGVKSYSSFLLISIFAITPVLIYMFFKNSQSRNATNGYHELTKSNTESIFCVSLLLGSITPFLLVGKSTSLFWLDFWSGRHSIPLAPALGLFSAKLLKMLSLDLPSKLKVKTGIISVILVVGLCSSLIMRDFLQKNQLLNLKYGITSSLIESKIEIPEGYVNVQVSGVIPFEFTPLESNYLMYKVTDNLNHYSKISNHYTKFDKYVPPTSYPAKWELYIDSKRYCYTRISLSRISSNIIGITSLAKQKFKVTGSHVSCEFTR